jgi:hypothetical protein
MIKKNLNNIFVDTNNTRDYANFLSIDVLRSSKIRTIYKD